MRMPLAMPITSRVSTAARSWASVWAPMSGMVDVVVRDLGGGERDIFTAACSDQLAGVGRPTFSELLPFCGLVVRINRIVYDRAGHALHHFRGLLLEAYGRASVRGS